MNKITSFTIDHDFITPGFYISRKDDNITTYDLRTRKPNAGEYMDNLTMHSTEHMLATFLRNSELKDNVIYFGPMGCQTGFYLLMKDTSDIDSYNLLKDVLEKTMNYDGEIFGNSRKECGNYKNLNLESAKKECAKYLDILIENEKTRGVNFNYEQN